MDSITRHRDIESLQTAAAWPGADRATVVTLAARLVAAGQDAEGYRYFAGFAGTHPGEADPFKFLIYAELAGAELGPVQ